MRKKVPTGFSKIHRLCPKNTGFAPFIFPTSGYKLLVDGQVFIKEKISKEGLEKLFQKKDNESWIFSSALRNPVGGLLGLPRQSGRS